MKPKTSNGKAVRLFWMQQFRQWHWISAAICLVGTLLFAVTGITLNHADIIGAEPKAVKRVATLAPDTLALLKTGAEGQPLPAGVAAWVKEELAVSVEAAAVEWSPEEAYVSLPIPGGDSFLTIDRETGEAVYDKTTRGWVSYLNDLHKGRNTGLVWKLFIDVFAVGCVVFTLTGLGLLFMYADRRKITWPLVAAGIFVPVLLALLFIH